MGDHRIPRQLVLGLACLALLAGCGSPDTVEPGTVEPGTVEPGTVEPGTSPRPKPSVTPGVTVQGSDTVVIGTVEQGVETGCLLLQGFLLLGGPADHTFRSGETVKVTGRVNPNLVTTCQQGVPLVVSAVEPA